MIITRCPSARSPSSNFRPVTIGTPIAGKNCGAITRSTLEMLLPMVASRPSGTRPLVPPPPMAAYDVIRRRRDSRRGSGRVLYSPQSGDDVRRIGAGGCRQRHPRRQDAVRIEAGVGPLQRDAAANQQPLPTNRSSDSAASPAIRPPRSRSRGPVVEPRPPSRSALCTSRRDTRSAGARPLTTLLTKAMPIAKASAVGSMRACSRAARRWDSTPARRRQTPARAPRRWRRTTASTADGSARRRARYRDDLRRW